MADIVAYWKRYPKESGATGQRVINWRTNSERFIKQVHPGDRLWLIISGELINDQKHSQLAFLAGAILVESIDEDPKRKLRFNIIGDPEMCFLINPPVLADHIFRPTSGKGANPKISIGKVRQTQYTLTEDKVKELLKIFSEHFEVEESKNSELFPSEPLLPESTHVPDKVWQEILDRRGQHEFRAKLLEAYSRRCAITRCDAVEALEACHLVSYAKFGSQSVTNGILLRADLHTLFDLNLIAIDPDGYLIQLGVTVRPLCCH